MNMRKNTNNQPSTFNNLPTNNLQYQMNPNHQNIQSTSSNKHLGNIKIRHQIQQISYLHKQLRNFAEKLSSIIKYYPRRNVNAQIDSIIEKQQNKISQLIQNMQEFYIDLDKRIKGLGSMILQSGIKVQDNTQAIYKYNQPHKLHMENRSDKMYSQLSNKIDNLQKSLEQTKRNESKLIGVIETLMKKYDITQQPTFIRSNPSLRRPNQVNNLQKTENNYLTLPKPPKKVETQTYMDQSVVTSNINQLKQRQKQFVSVLSGKKIERRQNYDLNRRSPQPNNFVLTSDSKTSLKNESRGLAIRSHTMHMGNNSDNFNEHYKNTAQMYDRGDRQRRMNYMINKLNY